MHAYIPLILFILIFLSSLAFINKHGLWIVLYIFSINQIKLTNLSIVNFER